jgi:hypothetical protein
MLTLDSIHAHRECTTSPAILCAEDMVLVDRPLSSNDKLVFQGTGNEGSHSATVAQAYPRSPAFLV